MRQVHRSGKPLDTRPNISDCRWSAPHHHASDMFCRLQRRTLETDMQALLFELKPREGHEEHYFRHAAALRPLLAQQEGLNYIDRFRSLSRPGVILSHSLWRDEASLAKWRTNRRHHRSQAAGRDEHFEDYRLRISHVLAHASRGQEEKHWTRDGAYRAAESRTLTYQGRSCAWSRVITTCSTGLKRLSIFRRSTNPLPDSKARERPCAESGQQ